MEGRIEGPDGEPIAGAIVSIEALGLVTESDTEGSFTLYPVALLEEARSLSVRVEHEGYEAITTEIVSLARHPHPPRHSLWCHVPAVRQSPPRFLVQRGNGAWSGSVRGFGQRMHHDALEIAVGLENEVGRIVAGAFDASAEMFHIGEGGPTDPDWLVLRVRARNEHCFALMDVVVTGTLFDSSVRYRGVVGGYPDHGTIQEETPGFIVWRSGELQAGGMAELRLRGEATAAGENVHRVELFATEIAGAKVHEEPITIHP